MSLFVFLGILMMLSSLGLWKFCSWFSPRAASIDGSVVKLSYYQFSDRIFLSISTMRVPLPPSFTTAAAPAGSSTTLAFGNSLQEDDALPSLMPAILVQHHGRPQPSRAVEFGGLFESGAARTWWHCRIWMTRRKRPMSFTGRRRPAARRRFALSRPSWAVPIIAIPRALRRSLAI